MTRVRHGHAHAGTSVAAGSRRGCVEPWSSSWWTRGTTGVVSEPSHSSTVATVVAVFFRSDVRCGASAQLQAALPSGADRMPTTPTRPARRLQRGNGASLHGAVLFGWGWRFAPPFVMAAACLVAPAPTVHRRGRPSLAPGEAPAASTPAVPTRHPGRVGCSARGDPPRRTRDPAPPDHLLTVSVSTGVLAERSAPGWRPSGLLRRSVTPVVLPGRIPAGGKRPSLPQARHAAGVFVAGSPAELVVSGGHRPTTAVVGCWGCECRHRPAGRRFPTPCLSRALVP